MPYINILRLTLIGLLVLLGTLLQFDLHADQTVSYMVSVPVMFLILLLFLWSLFVTIFDWKIKLILILLSIFSASFLFYYFGPEVPHSVFYAFSFLTVAIGIGVEISATNRAPKTWLWFAYVWVCILYTLVAKERFAIANSVAYIIFVIVLILSLRISVEWDVIGKHRWWRLLCLVYLITLIIMSSEASTPPHTTMINRPTYVTSDRKDHPRYVPSKKVEYPSTWTTVKTVDLQTFPASTMIPTFLTNPAPALVEPNYHPGYQPSTNPNRNKLTFIYGIEDDGTEYIYAEGPIKKGAYEKFLLAVETYRESGKSPSKFVIHTPGGLVAEGLTIGMYIRQHGWNTQVDTVVAAQSTGGFIFISGVEQIIKGEGAVGFHRPFIPSQPDTVTSIAQIYQLFMPYWKYMGGTPELYEKMMSVSRDEMFYVTKENADQYLATFEVHFKLPIFPSL